MLLTQTTRDIRYVEAALKTALDHVRSYATGDGARTTSPGAAAAGTTAGSVTAGGGAGRCP